MDIKKAGSNALPLMFDKCFLCILFKFLPESRKTNQTGAKE